MKIIGLFAILLLFSFCQKRDFSFGTLQGCEVAKKDANLASVRIKSSENNQIFTFVGNCRYENAGGDTIVVVNPKTYMEEVSVKAEYYLVGNWKKRDEHGQIVATHHFPKNNRKRFELCKQFMLIYQE